MRPAPALEAVHMAIRFIQTKPVGTFAIATDSMSVISALEKASMLPRAGKLLCHCRSGLHSLKMKFYEILESFSQWYKGK